MHAFNAAATHVAAIAFREQSANKFDLQKLVYGELRTAYTLPAQLAIRAISKASEAYKRDKSIQPTLRPEGAIIYYQSVMSLKSLKSLKSLTTVSLLTLAGRVLVPFLVGTYQESRMDTVKGQADLLYRKGAFYKSERFSYDCRRIADLLLIDNFVSTGMFLTFPHAFISDCVNMPAVLCHFLYMPKKLIPCFPLKHS
jgi:hypothetical protein